MKNFTLAEFTCKCGCGIAAMQESTLLKLDKARERTINA